MNKLMEKFVWPSTNWKTKDVGKRTIRIKGVAIRGDVVSRNLRHYLAKELKKSTNTWLDPPKPVTINHVDSNKIGHITWMDYDEERNELLYEAEINREPYVSMIRNKSSEIHGISIQAKYMFNYCEACKRKFYDEELFQQHMWEEHFKKISAVPHGIVGEAISVVLSPEVPGYDDTSITLAEMAKREILRLSETIIKEEKEKEQYEMKKTDKIKAPVAVIPRAEHAMGPVAEIKEQEDIEPGSRYCDEHPDDPRCKEHKAAIHGEEQEAPSPPCPEGWHEVDGQCVKDEPEATEQEETPTPPCPDGYHEVEGKCIKDEPQAEEQVEEMPTPEPETTDETPTEEEPEKEEPINPAEEAPVDAPVVTVPVPPEEEVVLEGYKLPDKMRLGEPFAGYDNFDDCVSKNPDKEDPDAYCADIMRKVEGDTASEIKETANVYEMQKAILNALTVERRQTYIRSIRLAEAVNKLNSLMATAEKNESAIMTYLNKREKAVNKAFDETNVNINKSLKEFAANTTGALKSTVANVNKAFKKLPKDDKGWKNIKPYNDAKITNDINTIISSHNNTVENLEKLKEKVEDLEKKNAEKDALIEKVAGERNKIIEDQAKKIEKLEEDVKEQKEEKKQLQETFGTRIDNLEDKQRGDFKGKHVKETTTDGKSIPTDKSPLEEE